MTLKEETVELELRMPQQALRSEAGGWLSRQSQLELHISLKPAWVAEIGLTSPPPRVKENV